MNNTDWTPPPPPREDSIYSQGTLEYYTDEISKGATKALIFGILSIFCCPPIFAYFAYDTAQDVLTNIEVYQVGHNKKGLAQAGKILAVIGIVMWLVGMVIRLAA